MDEAIEPQVPSEPTGSGQPVKFVRPLEAARQSLLAAIDSGQDITDLLAQIGTVNSDLQAQQAVIDAGKADMDKVSKALDGVDTLLTDAKAEAGG